MSRYWIAVYLLWIMVGNNAWGVESIGIDVIPGMGLDSSSDPVGGTPMLLSNVPAYNWYHGCGPTAAASVIGYYDVHGFDNLFTASGWNAVKLTSNVQDQISSPAYNAKYDPTPDNTSLPVPPKTSIASWFETSKDPLEYGWAYLSKADVAFRGYINYRGYQCSSWSESYGSLTWQDLMNEINAGRPMMFLVDTDGNGGTDHFVPVFGYEDRGANGKYYACYTTWTEDETVAWYKFQSMGNAWGVGYGTFLQVVPEPSTLVLLGMSALGLLVYAWRRRRR